MRGVRVEEIQCKTILNRSVMPFADYTLNAYQGCAFACSYCYVPAMRARRGQIDETQWGGWVQVKVNASDVLRRQMLKVEPHEKIAIGTATDSWQPLEKKYGIARGILQELSYYPNPVSLLTRSPLLLRDVDLLEKLESLSVGVSLPTFDERIRRGFEPLAPGIPGRVHLVRKLMEAGIVPSLFLCPILPGVMDTPEAIRDYMRNAAELGVQRVICSTLNYTEHVGATHARLLRGYNERHRLAPTASPPYPALKQAVTHWAAHYGLRASV